MTKRTCLAQAPSSRRRGSRSYASADPLSRHVLYYKAGGRSFHRVINAPLERVHFNALNLAFNVYGLRV